jgi:hypothetical protein
MSMKRTVVNQSECENVAKMSRISLTLETNICTTEDGQTYPDVCRSMKLPPKTVSTIIKNTDEIEPSMQPATRVSATKVSHGRRKLLQKV